MELSDFLLARIAEDEAAARGEWDWMIERRGEDFWTTGEGAPVEDEWMYQVDRDASLHVSPRRVLAECEAKRRIVELHRMGGEYTPGDDQRDGFRYCATCGSGEPYEYPTAWPCETLRLLALPFADHPDYRQVWAL